MAHQNVMAIGTLIDIWAVEVHTNGIILRKFISTIVKKIDIIINSFIFVLFLFIIIDVSLYNIILSAKIDLEILLYLNVNEIISKNENEMIQLVFNDDEDGSNIENKLVIIFICFLMKWFCNF